MIQYSKTYNVFTIAFRANLARGANLDQNDEVRKNFRTSIFGYRKPPAKRVVP